MDAAKVLCQTELAIGVGTGNQLGVDRRLLAVDIEKLRSGLEVWAGETGVGVRAVLLRWSAAVAVGEAVTHASEVVLDPLGVRGESVQVEGQRVAVGVDPLVAVALEGVAHGVVVDLGVAGGHARAGVAEQLLDDVLGHPGIDQPSADGVAELMGMDPHPLTSFVAQSIAFCQFPSWWERLPCAYTGLRAGEVEALRVRRLDLLHCKVEVAETVGEVHGHGLVYGSPKTYESRSVPVPRFLCSELMTLVAGKDPNDFVFTGPQGGPIRHTTFYHRHFKRAVHEAGLPDALRFHDLRHTYAAMLIAQGAHPRAMMERLGHSSVTVTLNTYGHLLPALETRLDEALDRVGRAAREESIGSRGSRLGHAPIVAFDLSGHK